MLGLSMSVMALALQGRRGLAGGLPVLRAAFLGQSEIHYILGTSFNQLPQPALPPTPNLTLVTRAGQGTAPLVHVVDAATVASGQINPAMSALSAFLAHAAPGRHFVIANMAQSGTSRRDLADDSNPARNWSDLAEISDLVEAEFGPIQHLIECWYNADAARIVNFRANFWPLYFGANGDGTPFALGTDGPQGRVDHCFWDGTAQAAQKGRGLFARAQTLWHVLTPMPFWNMPQSPDPEAPNFSAGAPRLSEPARATMRALVQDGLAQSVGLRVGPSAHLCKFGGMGGPTHPDPGDRDGTIGFMWPFALALLRAAGQTIHEPDIVGCTVASDGSHADLIVDLPNGGFLSTLRSLRGGVLPAQPSPHQQSVTGIEITRGPNRRPVFRADATDYPTALRGNVEIIDTGSGTPRRGRVRITPEQPFQFGDALSYLRGQATAGLLEPRDRDNRLYLDHLIEHLPALYDANATYPFEGIAVRPLQEDIALPLTAPVFVARGAAFDGSSYFNSNAINLPAQQTGLVSVWFRNDDPAGWNASGSHRLVQLRVGTTTMLELHVANNAALRLMLRGGGTNQQINMKASPEGADFVTGRWYHALVGWSGDTGYVAAIDGQIVGSGALGSLDFAGQSFTRIGVGAQTSGSSALIGSMAHLWLSVNQTLDLTDPANRARFVQNGLPVDLGGSGQLPTGNAPDWYYDGAAPDWSNRGSAGNVALVGGPLAPAPLPIP